MKKSLLLAVLILFAQLLTAQDSLQFKHGTYKVTINTPSQGMVVKGYLQSLTDTSVYISPRPVAFLGYANNNSQGNAFKYDNIADISLRRKGSTGRGILIGAVAGALTGTMIGLASGDDYKDNHGACFICFTAGEKAAAGGILLGVTGSIVGGVVGALVHKTFIIKSRRENFDELRWSLVR